MEAIGALARAYGVAVIEDASHAIGGYWQGAAIGACVHSDITVFSFHPVKIITTAEGGLATTNNPELAARMERLRSHGITRDPALMTQEPDGPWYYQQIDLGLNYRMTEMQAALGLSQMKRLKEFVARRHVLADRYDYALTDLPLATPTRHPGSYSSFHLYIILLNSPARRREIFEALREQGVGVNIHYIPVHMQPYYRNLGFRIGDFPISEDYYSRAISIPLFSTMTDTQQNKVIDALKSALE
jgi:dTDP-4-amino-4,6-dideoxygalactose transaminase